MAVSSQASWPIAEVRRAVAFSRTSSFDEEKSDHKHVLRRFGQVPDEYLKGTTGE